MPTAAVSVTSAIDHQLACASALARAHQQQALAARVEHEHERHQKRRHGVLPALQRGLVRVAAGDRGGGERRQRGRRRHLGQHRVVEDEHVRREVGHAELDQRRRGDHRADDVARGHRHREADDPHHQRGEDRGQQQRAAGIVDHDRAELQPQPGERDHADDDAGAGAGGRDVEHADRAAFHRLDERRAEQLLGERALALEQVVGQQRGVAPQHAGGERHHRGPEHATAPARSRHIMKTTIETSERKWNQYLRVSVPHRFELAEVDVAHAVLARVDLHHQEQRQVEQQRRDDRHQQHVEVGDLQELGDQERRGAEHRRRDDRAQAAGREQAAGGVVLVAHLVEHRVGHRAERDGGGHARARRPAEQERRQHHGAAGAGGLAAHRREREVDEELAGARVLQEGAEDREQDDQRRRHVDRDAVDALQRHVHHADQAADLVALVRPRRRQVGPAQRIGDERRRDHRHDPAGGAPHRLEHQHDQRDAERDVPGQRRGVAVGEVVAAVDQVDHDRDRQRDGQPVPPHDAVAKAPGQREHQEVQAQHERHVQRPQRLRRHDGVGGVEVERRHHEGERPARRARASPSACWPRLLRPR